ncbi:MAG: DHH family phosphoesterase [Oscillospiraceae bacterium]|nr:DHH family phosphoesterase [Oscillospiraceae bacterium]MBR3952638.1 DHH family phosphoesterase [Oscillospiraceae bacterium]
MKKKIDLLEITLIAFMAVMIIFTGMSAAYDKKIFVIQLIITLGALAFGIWRLFAARRDSRKFLEYVGGRLGAVRSDTLIKFPMPVAVANGEGEIIWSNSLFHEEVMKGEEVFGKNISEFLGGFEIEKAFAPGGCEAICGGGSYSVFATTSEDLGEKLFGLYFIDRTNEKRVEKLYDESRPAVLSIALDNLEELFANCKESEKSWIKGEVEKLFEDFVAENHAFLKRNSSSKYVAVVEEKYLRKMEERRFSILDRARKILTSEDLPVTLSIGVARGDYSLDKLNEISLQALEMALGRGGDQAAVKNVNGYEFYGGYAKGIEKRTKVKTRVIGAALADLIESSSNVLVMGHRFGDLDCIGAAIGMAEGVRDMEKNCHIVVNRETCLAKPLIDKTEKAGTLELFISPEEAKELINEDTLLIIVDTHIRGLLESQDIYNACRNVVVIDHHRRMVGSIDNAVIFYHEPYASSASEMVTELLQYLDSRCRITKAEAEALLAGIMLDTKSFSMRAGVRTFEAAAYLKKMGADTVKVKELFSGSLSSYQHRSKIVSTAEIYRGCAVSFAKSYDDIGIVAPQAADELLAINGVASSVVMYKTAVGVSFSARSLGGMNVQVIMEALGGGGHQTMAGAQIPDITPQEAKEKLLAAIDDYYEKAAGHADE